MPLLLFVPSLPMPLFPPESFPFYLDNYNKSAQARHIEQPPSAAPNPRRLFLTHRLNHLSIGLHIILASLLCLSASIAPSTIHEYCTISNSSHFFRSISPFCPRTGLRLRPGASPCILTGSSEAGQASTGGAISVCGRKDSNTAR